MSLFSLEGKKAIVTGASRGIGQAIAIGLAKAGADVVCSSTTKNGCDETMEQINKIGRRAFHIQADLSNRMDQDHLIDSSIQTLQGVDILINNAGTIQRSPAITYNDEAWDEVIEVNLTAAFRLSRRVASCMMDTGSGKIINIASLLSIFGGITVPAYTASKHALFGITKALSNEWAGHGIQVNAIAPGYIKTDNTLQLQKDKHRYETILQRIPAGRWGESEDLVGAAIFLSSNASNFVNGTMLTVDGGWTAR
jgi:2-deoxy-D-gluconate 3-dehydrogenase